jgi:hypothetical protein
MFTLEKNKNNVPLVIVRGDTSLNGEIIYMRSNKDEDEEKPRRKTNNKKKKGGRVRFADYDEFEDEMSSDEEDSQAEEVEEEGVDSFTLDSGKFELLPNTEERQRHCIFVAGRSGSGKSTYCRNYIKNYLKMKKNPVYIFSALETDDTFDDLKINRIILDDDIVQNPIDCEELKNSLCIMDDIDIIKDPKIKKAVYDLQDQILEIGRHSNIDIINTSHKVTDGRRTRNLLNESSHIVIFPCRGSNITRYYLDKYSGLDKNNIKRIYNSSSRWTCMQIGFPGFVLQEKELYLPE